MVRAFCWYGAPIGLATTPSSPAPSNCVEPALGLVGVGRRPGEVRRPGRARRARPPAGARRIGERPVDQRLVAEGQQVEGHEAGRGLLGQHLDPRGGRVDPLLEHLELQPRPDRHEQLAVEHAPVRQLLARGLHDLGEVAGQRLGVARGQLDLVAVRKTRQRKPSHFGSKESPPSNFAGSGMPLTGLGQHRLHGRHHGQVHSATVDDIRHRPLSRSRAQAPDVDILAAWPTPSRRLRLPRTGPLADLDTAGHPRFRRRQDATARRRCATLGARAGRPPGADVRRRLHRWPPAASWSCCRGWTPPARAA